MVTSYSRDVDEVSIIDELPEWEFAFRFTSRRLCLSYCATVGERWRRCFERLRTPADLARWLVDADVLSERVEVTDRQLAQARRLREAIYRAVRAAMSSEQVTDEDRRIINRFARRYSVSPQLRPERQLQRWVGHDPVGAGLASVAVDAVELLTGPEMARVRECAAPDCALLFLDTSRPGRRRWCADGACGSRSRAANYRSRRRAPDPAAIQASNR